DGRILHGAGDRLHALEVTVGAGGEAGLDHVDLQALELARDAQLLVARHGGAGRLFAVAQGGVEDDELVCHGVLLYRWWVEPATWKNVRHSRQKARCGCIRAFGRKKRARALYRLRPWGAS